MDELNMPEEIWARRISDKPTGIEIVFGEVDNPMHKYIRADLVQGIIEKQPTEEKG